MTRYSAIGKDLIVKRTKRDMKKGDLILPGKEKDNRVFVLNIGGDVEEVNRGDTVIIRDRCGATIETGTNEDGFYEYLMVSIDDIICVVDVED